MQIADADIGLQNREKLRDIFGVLKKGGIEIPDNAANRLLEYSDLIRMWNRRTQLVSRNDEDFIISRHIAECLAPACVFDFQRLTKLLDFGSGAGLPGIPLAIIFPDLKVSLLEPKRKKLLFLRFSCTELKLENIKILPFHSDEIPGNELFVYDAVIARAVAQLDKLWLWSQVLLNSGGCLLAMKGGDVNGEMQNLLKHKTIKKVQVFEYPRVLVAPEKERKVVIVNRA